MTDPSPELKSARVVELTVSPDEDGARIDKALAVRLGPEGISRSMIAHWCEAGRVTLRGAVVRSSVKLRAGDALVLHVPPPEPLEALAEDIPLTVVFEDAALMVVDKPAGLVVHPARGHASGTLVNAVLHHADVDDEDPLRPGIVHRIDKDTSGLLVIAKTPAAREGLSAQFKAHSIERMYLALTEGLAPETVTYDTLHGRHPTDRLRFSARVREGRRAVTHVRRVEAFGALASRVECRLETGRTHQIRMHLSEAGFPLLGDGLYGRTPKSAKVAAVAEALGRQALHAAVLGFVHPVTHARVLFRSEPPEDLVRAIEALRALGRAAGTR